MFAVLKENRVDGRGRFSKMSNSDAATNARLRARARAMYGLPVITDGTSTPYVSESGHWERFNAGTSARLGIGLVDAKG